MDMEKVAGLVKLAKMTKDERNRRARTRNRNAGAAIRKQKKLKQRVKRRQGGLAMKARVKRQNQRLKYKPTRVRKEPLVARPRDRS